MARLGKSICLCLVGILAISTLLMIKPVDAQVIPKPSVPEFTVDYVVHTSYIEPTYTINPYTGENETKTSGGQVTNETVVFTIRNQPFAPYEDTNGNYIGFYFNFRYKGHYETQWSYEPFNPDGKSVYAAGGWAFGPFPHYAQSSSDYTTFTFKLHKFIEYSSESTSDGQLDFQVQAQIGNIFPSEGVSPSLGSYYNFTGQTSDWSSTHTITIGENSNTPSPSPTVPEFPITAVLSLLIVLPLLVTVLLRRKNQQK